MYPYGGKGGLMAGALPYGGWVLRRLMLLLTVLSAALAATAPGPNASPGIARSTIKLVGAPVGVAVGAGGVWVLVGDASGERLLRLDAATGAVRSTMDLGRVGSESGGVAVGAGAVWAAAGSQLVRIDPARDTISATVAVGAQATSVFATPSAVWVTRASGRLGQLVRVDPGANRVVARTTMGGGPDAVVAALGSTWVTNSSPSSLMRIDPRTNKVLATFLPARFSSSLAVAQGLLWVAGERTVLGLNARGRIVRHLPLTRAVIRIAAADGQLWGTDNCGCAIGRLLRINLRRGRVTKTFTVGHTPVALAAGDGAIWVANFNDASLTRIPD